MRTQGFRGVGTEYAFKTFILRFGDEETEEEDGQTVFGGGHCSCGR